MVNVIDMIYIFFLLLFFKGLCFKIKIWNDNSLEIYSYREGVVDETKT